MSRGLQSGIVTKAPGAAALSRGCQGGACITVLSWVRRWLGARSEDQAPGGGSPPFLAML